MAETPKNQVLSSQQATATVKSPAPPSIDAYPKMLVHKNSKANALLTKQVNSAEEEKEAGSDWVTLADLDFETAPAEKKDADAD